MKLIKTLRNHWKKSIFFSIVGLYGVRWGIRRMEDDDLRRRYCLMAKEFGSQPIPPFARNRKVTVLLNPAAGDNSSRKLFDETVAPLLHLGGLDVHVIKTEFEGQARGYMEVIEKDMADSVVLVGGSGLVVEAVTGLLRRPDSKEIVDNISVGIIPTGKHSTLVRALMSPVLPRSPRLGDVKFMCEAAMAILRGKTTKIDVLQIEAGVDESDHDDDISDHLNSLNNSPDSIEPSTDTTKDSSEKKTIFAVAGLEWGLHRDVAEKSEKYWYWGKRLRHKVAYLFSTLTFQPWPKSIAAQVDYVESCEGCSKCFVSETSKLVEKNAKALNGRSFFQRIYGAGNKSKTPVVEEEEDRSSIINDSCGQIKSAVVEGSQFVAVLDSIARPDGLTDRHRTGGIDLYTSPTPSSRKDFVADGWARLREKPLTGFDAPRRFLASAREFYLRPRDAGDGESIGIDDETFEAKPMKVTLLKKRLSCFVATESV